MVQRQSKTLTARSESDAIAKFRQRFPGWKLIQLFELGGPGALCSPYQNARYSNQSALYPRYLITMERESE